MPFCAVHKDFFVEECKDCKDEYEELKGHTVGSSDRHVEVISSASGDAKGYKDFSEDRARKLYEQLLLQFLNPPSRLTEVEAARKARYIIKKQCLIRGLPGWKWLE
jgi:hypothetical protein